MPLVDYQVARFGRYDPAVLVQARKRIAAAAETAAAVGRRHGKLALLRVDAARMAADGHVFYCSDNGVWLTDAVPVSYLAKLAV